MDITVRSDGPFPKVSPEERNFLQKDLSEVSSFSSEPLETNEICLDEIPIQILGEEDAPELDEERPAELLPPPSIPSKVYSGFIEAIKGEIARVEKFCASEPEVLASNIGITTKDYYAIWGVLLQLAGVIGAGTNREIIGVGAPDSQGMSTNLVGVGVRPVHAFVMNDTRLKANAARQNEINGCVRYFNLTKGIDQLLELEKRLKDGISATGLAPDDKAVAQCLKLIQQSRSRLLAEANKLESTVRAPLSKVNEQARGAINTFRGTLIGLPNAGNAFLQTVVGGLKTSLAVGQKLTGAALELSNASSGISGALGILSGIANNVHAGLECYSAKAAKAALQKNEDNDKFVCATYGRSVPVLQDLARLRKDMRSLKFTVENLLYLQAGARAVNGTTSIVVGCLGIAALCGAVTAASMGSAALALALIVGAYYLITHVRQWMETRETRALEKEIARIAVLYGSSNSGIPGLSLASDAKGADQIADELAQVLSEGGEAARDCKRALVEMGLPESVLDVGGKTAKDIAKQIRPYLNASSAVTEKEAIEKQYSDSKTAFAAVNILAREEERTEKERLEEPAESAKPEPFPWHRRLASGADATDIRKSSFDEKTFRKSWGEEPGNIQFQEFVIKSLGLENRPPADAKAAWNALTKARKDAADKAYENGPAKQKVMDTVMRWLADGDVKAIEQCLSSDSKDPFKKTCRKTLELYFSPGTVSRQAFGRVWLMMADGQKLGLDTIGMFQRASNSKVEGLSGTVLRTTEAFMGDLRVKIHEDDRAGFDAAMGIHIQDGSVKINRADLPKVLERLEKFLFITRKLHGQKLEKVIASLHTYPTWGSGVPDNIVREAAMLEIRRRYPEPVLTSNSTDAERAKVEDLQQTMRLVSALRKEKLHGRAFGAGDGGGVLLFGGYKLNDKGLLVKRLLECCDKGGLPAGVLSGELFTSLTKTKVPDIQNGLFHWAKKMLKDADMDPRETNDSIARKLDLYHTPGALEKALKSGKKAVREEAQKVFLKKFKLAEEQVQASVDLMNNDAGRDQFNVPSFIQEMQTYFTLQQLGKKHGLPDEGEVVTMSQGDTLTQRRLEFYRDALLWSNATARAKNVKAIELELTRMKAGEPQQANRFWSAKFLGVHPAEGKNERKLLSGWLGDLNGTPPRGKTPPYKLMAVKCEALVNMSKTQVFEAVRSNSGKGNLWLRWFLEQNGLSLQKLEALKQSLTTGDGQRAFFKSLAGAQRKMNQEKIQAWVSQMLEPFAKPKNQGMIVMPEVAY